MSTKVIMWLDLKSDRLYCESCSDVLVNKDMDFRQVSVEVEGQVVCHHCKGSFGALAKKVTKRVAKAKS